MPNDNIKSQLHLHLIVFVWGFTAVLGALISLNAAALVWWRVVLASLFIFGYCKIMKIKLKADPKIKLKLVLSGLIITAHWLTFFQAIKISNVSVTLACLATGAFFASLLEPIFYKRKIIGYEVVLGLVVIVGLSIIFKVETQYWQGIVLALLSAFLSAFFSIVNGKFAQHYPPSVISFYELLGGVLFLSVFLFFSGSFSPDFFVLSASDWFLLFLLASVCTAYAFIASVAVLKHLSPYTVMLTINLEPVYGIILALLTFGNKEKMNPNFYIGASIILITVVLNGILKNYTKKKKQKREV